jgi:hypothetical protein
MVDIIESDFPVAFIGSYALAKLGITIGQLEKESGCPKPYIIKVLEHGPEFVQSNKLRDYLLKALYQKSGMVGSSFWIRFEETELVPETIKLEQGPKEQFKEEPNQKYKVIDRGEFFKEHYQEKKTGMIASEKDGKMTEAQKQRRALSTVHNKQNKKIGQPIRLTPAKVALIEHGRPEADLVKIVSTPYIRTAIINGKRPHLPRNSRKSVAEYKRGLREWFADTLNITWDQLDPFTRRTYKWNPEAGRFDDLDAQTESERPAPKPIEDKPGSRREKLSDSDRQLLAVSTFHNNQKTGIGEPIRLTPAKVALIEHGRPEANLAGIGEQSAKKAVAEEREDKEPKCIQTSVAGAPQLLIESVTDNSSAKRLQSIDALGKMKCVEACECLGQALEDEDRRIRLRALSALEEIGRAACPEIVLGLSAAHADIRKSAATTLGRTGRREAITPLITATRDKDKLVRYAAVRALGNLSADEIANPIESRRINALVQSSEDPDWEVREAAKKALTKVFDRLLKPAD